MNIPYRTRRTLNRVGTGLLIFLLVFVVVWFCWVIWIERYIVYTKDGAQLDLSLSSNELVGEVALPPEANAEVSIYYNEGSDAVETSKELTQLDGYYIDHAAMTSDISGVWDDLDNLSSGTPVMIDLKGGYGSFYYTSSVSGAISAQSVSTASIDELIKELKSKGFYTIARISAFRDYCFGLNHVSSGLYMLNRAGLWADDGGCYWLNPTDSTALNYISSVVLELKEMGFNEVVLTDFRFPNSEKYIFSGDKDEALQNAAAQLMSNCVSSGETFTLSFSVTSATFQLPEGRCRMYLEGVEAGNVAAKAAQVTIDDIEARLVFIAETNDTRFNDYGVLRPLSVSEVLETQKAEAKAKAEASGSSTSNNTGTTATSETAATSAAVG